MIVEITISILFYSFAFIIGLLLAPVPQKKTEKGYEELDKQNAVNIVELYVSLIHSNSTTFLMLYCYFTYSHEILRPMNYMEELAFCNSLGYMIYNMFPHYFNKTLDIFIFWHHVASMFIFVATLKYHWGIYLLTFSIGVSEL